MIMIEIKELRVGNWVIKDGENYKITNVNDYIASIVNPIALDEKLYQDIISDSNNLIFGSYILSYTTGSI